MHIHHTQMDLIGFYKKINKFQETKQYGLIDGFICLKIFRCFVVCCDINKVAILQLYFYRYIKTTRHIICDVVSDQNGE